MKILFAGTPDFAAAHLQALLDSRHRICGVITQPDKPGKRGKRLVPSPVKQLAASRGLALLQPKKLTADDIRRFEADLMVVVAYGQILSGSVLAAPRLGCINVHASLLPRWRGAAPMQHAILAGDEVSGITIIQMDEGLDTGDMLATRQVALDPDETAASLAAKLARVGPAALMEAIDGLESGTVEPVRQDDSRATYAHKITKDDARLHWPDAARTLSRAVRAFNPDPVAYSFLEDLRVKIWAAREVPRESGDRPGTITALGPDGVTVACGENALLLERVQLPLGKGSILSGVDILNARKDLLAPGKRLG